MGENDTLIVAIVFGIIGIISIIIIISFIIWFIRRKNLQSKKLKKNSSISHRPHYQPSQKLTSIKSNNNQRKKRKRFNTNDSVISLSFNPPHLINQNVKNLDTLRPTDRSWPYGNTVQTVSNKDYR